MDERPFSRILVAFDGSDNALRACGSAAQVARATGSEVVVVYVIPTLSIYTAPLADEYYAVQQEKGEELVRGGMAVFEGRGVRARSEIVRARWSIVDTIIEYAGEHKCDLIVTGARGAGGYEKMLLGSVASGVVARARCPVMIVR